jgi:hypothetical protein
VTLEVGKIKLKSGSTATQAKFRFSILEETPGEFSEYVELYYKDVAFDIYT